MPIKPLVRVLGACAVVLLACRAESSREGVAPEPQALASEPSRLEMPVRLVAAYPPAGWRIADPGALADAVLWFSQIVIRHGQARPEVSFNLAYWSSVALPTRSRAEALALAEHVADLAAKEPAGFAELARQYSEDLPSRDEGGAIGGSSALQLMPWPQILDAVYALKVGETSRVVETPYGFHILLRSQAPLEEVRSGSHIVIGHDQALWLSRFARGPRPPRTREQALALASAIYEKARVRPDSFAQLVQAYSEHRDAVVDGDFGAWSSREWNPFAPRTKRLAELAIGQVGKPIETHLGFEIILRTSPRPRALLRAGVVLFKGADFSGEAPSDPGPAQRAEALRKVEATARQLALDPSRFDALNVTFEQWEEGRANPTLGLALLQLQPGELTREPVDTEYGFVLAKRLEPGPAPTPRLLSELPVPKESDLARFLSSLGGRDAWAFLGSFTASVAREMRLDANTAARLETICERAAPDEQTRAELLSAKVSQVLEQTSRLLGGKRFESYQTALFRDAAALAARHGNQNGPLGL